MVTPPRCCRWDMERRPPVRLHPLLSSHVQVPSVRCLKRRMQRPCLGACWLCSVSLLHPRSVVCRPHGCTTLLTHPHHEPCSRRCTMPLQQVHMYFSATFKDPERPHFAASTTESLEVLYGAVACLHMWQHAH
jgi:hypothetical protein